MRRVVDPALVEVPPPAATSSTSVWCAWCWLRASRSFPITCSTLPTPVPFTGMIGMTNVVARRRRRAAPHLPAEVRAVGRSAAAVAGRTGPAVIPEGAPHAMLPSFDPPATSESIHINRAAPSSSRSRWWATLDGYSPGRAPSTRISTWSTRPQFVNSTLNNNEVIRAVDTFPARPWRRADCRWRTRRPAVRVRPRPRAEGRLVSSELSYFVHESAYVDEPCEIGDGTRIWHFSHVMRDSRIGEQVTSGRTSSSRPALRHRQQRKDPEQCFCLHGRHHRRMTSSAARRWFSRTSSIPVRSSSASDEYRRTR